ncbi:MAG: hypothetical protein WA910_05115 [Sphingopyxis granuli]
MTAARHAYASPGWRDAMRAILTALVDRHRHDFPDADFRMCEVVTAVPPDGGTVVLAARITGESVEFFDTEIDADIVVRGDHDAMLPAARLNRRRATPEENAAQAVHAMAMAKAGRVSMQGDMGKAPKPLLRVLAEMHDQLADITL